MSTDNYTNTEAEIRAQRLLCTQLQAQFNDDLYAAVTTNNPTERAVLLETCNADNRAIALAGDRMVNLLEAARVNMLSQAIHNEAIFSSKTLH